MKAGWKARKYNMSKKLGLAVSLILVILSLFTIFIFKSINKGETDDQSKLVVVSPHPTEFMIPLIQEFENETGISVELKSYGTKEAIECITKDENIDILWGGSLLAVGPYKDYFKEYKTENRSAFMGEFRAVEDEFTCFSNVPSVIVVNKDIIGDIEIKGYKDLLNEELKGCIAYADPGKSSSSFEHLVNMLYAMGDGDPDKGWEYVDKFIYNLDGTVLDSSSKVYQGVADGKFKVGLTFEEAAVTMIKNDKHIEIIYMEEGVVSTPDGIYINKNSKRTENAEKFVDFMTSKDAQRYMASDLGRRSVRGDVGASDLVIPLYKIKRISVDKKEVIDKQNEWIEKFNKKKKEASYE